VELDRQTVERRDFPIARRGYDPAAVDAHLRALAVEVEELQRAGGGAGAEPSLASSAGSQVQGIVAAAEAAAADIEQQARDSARQTRADADRDAEQTRHDAIEKARAHVAAVAQVAATLLERVGGMDTEVRALIDTLRAGAGRLTTDLAAVDANMGELYDAASGRTGAAPARVVSEPAPSAPAASVESRPAPSAPPRAVEPPPSAPPPSTAAGDAGDPAPAAKGDADLDSARLVALNMALNGDSRDETDRYLAENYELPDRAGLVDEVYAAIEG
jgi:DivIVA domain-containing protein